MLEVVTKGFRNARLKLQGKAEITEKNIDEALRDIRISLLEADVELHVVKAFLAHVKEKAVGDIIKTKAYAKDKKVQIGPGEYFIKLCHDELVGLMGEGERELVISKKGPTTIMIVGLNGSGKTTTAGKLAKLLQQEKKKRPMLIAADIYRPAAVEQLMTLGKKVDVPVFHREGMQPPDLIEEGLLHAKATNRNLVIIDTAGRLTVNEELMQELDEIKARVNPDNILLVVDAMIGQDAVKTASEFDRRLDITGVVLTKMDGDARGGAALSVRAVTGKRVMFVGMGESMDKLEEFRPDGIATRILGLGDVVGLVQDFEKVVDQEQAEEDALKILKGEFNLYQFLEQIRAIQKMGALKDTMEKLPFFHEMVPEGEQINDNVLVNIEAMINSMTHKERLDPEIIDDSRAKRIAKGSGKKAAEVKDLLVRFQTMKDMMVQMGKHPSLLSKIPGFKEYLNLAKARGEDVSDILPEEPGGRTVYGMPRLSAKQKEKRRKKGKAARKTRQKSKKKKKKKKK